MTHQIETPVYRNAKEVRGIASIAGFFDESYLEKFAKFEDCPLDVAAVMVFHAFAVGPKLQ